MKGIDFRRRRESLTNYKKRLALVKSGAERVVIRKSNKAIIGQTIKYSENGDIVTARADSHDLQKSFGWPSRANKPTAYLTGMLLAKKAPKGNRGFILDIGLSSSVKNSIPFIFAKGCIDGGMDLKANLNVDESTYNYSDVSYAKKLKESAAEMYTKQYGSYIKEKKEPESLHALFMEIKEKIAKM